MVCAGSDNIMRNRQPKGFKTCFFTEMWERYGFYAVQFTLTLYLLRYFGLTDDHIYEISGSFTAIAFMTPMLGGYLADRVFGQCRAVFFGAVLLLIGYSLIAALDSLTVLFIGLAVIALGTGLLKPNISSLLGTLYDNHDARRHTGFTLFYVGINLGQIVAAALAGLASHNGYWRLLYLTASLCLLAACIYFRFSQLYRTHNTAYRQQRQQRASIPFYQSTGLAYALCLIVLAVSVAIIESRLVSLVLFGLVVLAVIVLVLLQALRCDSARERNGIFAFFILTALSVVFWAIFFQLYTSINFYILRAVAHHLWVLPLPTATFGGLESLGVVLFGPVLGYLWTKLEPTRFNPGIRGKFTLGFVFMTLCMLVLWISAYRCNGGMVNAFWLVGAYFILALGELSLSAIGLSMVTEFVPQRVVGLMMGVWFLATGLGGEISGQLADISAIPSTVHSHLDVCRVYQHTFLTFSLISVAAAMVCYACGFWIKRLRQHSL